MEAVGTLPSWLVNPPYNYRLELSLLRALRGFLFYILPSFVVQLAAV